MNQPEKRTPESQAEDAKRPGLLRRMAARAFGQRFEGREAETATEPEKFTLKVAGETQVADLYKVENEPIAAREEALHPMPGTLAILTRPEPYGARSETVSYVFSVSQGETPHWLCQRVKRQGDGYQAKEVQPMKDLAMAQGADEKSKGLMAPVKLPTGSELLITHVAEIPEIQQVAEGSNEGNPVVQEDAARYQAVVEAALVGGASSRV